MFALTPGQPIKIAEGIWRLLALNPGMMSGPGTNTYLLADGEHGLMVLDPGPVDQRHLDNIVQAAQQLQRQLTRVLTTHTHRDHSPLAAQMSNLLQAEKKFWGADRLDDPLQDESWYPDHPVVDGEIISLGATQLQAIATPGHVGNHFCYWHLSSGLLFSGDHLINGSTVVIAPPSGSMRSYLSSLEKLLPLEFQVVAPGHGDLIYNPKAEIEKTIRHRLARESRVWDAAQQTPGQFTAQQLVTQVYDDVPAFLHGIATFSLEAHLIKLWEDGRLQRNENEYWLASTL